MTTTASIMHDRNVKVWNTGGYSYPAVKTAYRIMEAAHELAEMDPRRVALDTVMLTSRKIAQMGKRLESIVGKDQGFEVTFLIDEGYVIFVGLGMTPDGLVPYVDEADYMVRDCIWPPLSDDDRADFTKQLLADIRMGGVN